MECIMCIECVDFGDPHIDQLNVIGKGKIWLKWFFMHVRSYAHCASTHIPRSVKFEFLDPKNILLDTGWAMERALCNRGFVCNESCDKSPATCLVSQPLSPLAYTLSLRNLYYKWELHSALSIAHSVSWNEMTSCLALLNEIVLVHLIVSFIIKCKCLNIKANSEQKRMLHGFYSCHLCETPCF